ncbi:MAG: chitin synthase-domain-containing protein [Linnemannia elongata]|nr:MAG: chitin synthase-domain-containing protein [Linnemannia elongata]
MRLGSALVYWVVFSQPIGTESGKGSSDSTTGAAGDKNNNSADSGNSIDTENHVLMLVTCQASDQDDQIKSTLDSLALTDHDDGRKLLLVMADATWDVDGERSQASLACLRLMQPSTPIESEKPTLSSLSDDPFSEDIYSGYYVVDSRRIPYVLVLRAPDQDLVQEEYATWWKKKLILRWLYRVCFNEPISSFEYALFERVRWLMGGESGPDVFDMLLVAEAGIECDRRSLCRMVGTLRRNEKVMGVCAQRVISNATENWLTRVQDYENHLSFHFTSAFESTLSAVQCLPSRFSLVRIKLRCPQGSHYPGHYSIPILVHPDVISCFVGNKARTLHERSLLLQGAEDRYLTGLLHQTFPDRRIVYVPQGVYRSRATPDLLSFLQEQGRLLASSFHTLWRQIWILQLRGRFCCSLNFLALIEWLALVILPSAVLFSIVLMVMVAVGAAEEVEALDALPVILALCFMMAVVALQPLLGICLGGGERTFARNLYGAALFLVLLPFKTLALVLYVCFHSTGKFTF